MEYGSTGERFGYGVLNCLEIFESKDLLGWKIVLYLIGFKNKSFV